MSSIAPANPLARRSRRRSLPSLGPLLGRAKPAHLALAGLLYLFFAVFLLWPLVLVVAKGFYAPGKGVTFEYVRLIFADAPLRRGLANALLVAALVTTFALLLALPLAVLSVRYDFRGRALLAGLLLVPLVLPPFVGALGMRLVLGRFGTLTQVAGALSHVVGGGGTGPAGIDWRGHYSLVGVVVVEVLHLYPIMLLNLQASLANIDPAMEQAAANLGAGRWAVFRRVTLPLIRPGLFAGCTLVLIWSFTELGTPLMFEYNVITPVQIFNRLQEVAEDRLPYALVVVTLAVSTLLYAVGKLLLGRGYDVATTKASVASAARRLRGGRALLAALPLVIVIGLALLPHLAVVLTSLSEKMAWYKSPLPSAYTLAHYRHALTDELTLPAVRNSMLYALLATALAMAVGLAAAVVVVRSDVPGKGLIDTLAMLPLAVPGIVLAFGYLALSVWLKQTLGSGPGGRGRFPAFLDVQEQPTVLLVIAYAARRLPYVVRSAIAGLQQTPRDLELAAANLGARRATVLGRITVPLILANLVAGGLLAFAFAMLEVSDSLVLAQRRDYFPITRAIYELSQRLGDGIYIASALGVWAMAFLTLTLLATNSFLGKKMGAIFRV